MGSGVAVLLVVSVDTDPELVQRWLEEFTRSGRHSARGRRRLALVEEYASKRLRPAPAGQYVTARSLYLDFAHWCQERKVEPIPSETAFGGAIKLADFSGRPLGDRKRRVEGVNRFDGVALAMPRGSRTRS